MKTRIAFGTFAAVWIVVIALGIFVWLRHSQRIVLPDGTKLTLAAVTYGKHHEFPGLKIARARFNTATDVLCVWIREDFTNASPGDYTACALDKSGAFARATRPFSAIPPARARTSPVSASTCFRGAMDRSACKSKPTIRRAGRG
jgi:hypothetical protein